MYFKDYNKSITYFKKPFILTETIGHAGLRSHTLSNRYILPWACSSIGTNKREVIRKIYSEYLERTQIGFQINSFKEIELLFLCNGIIEKFLRKDLAYGYSRKFGIIDTTGSASGDFESSKIIYKAICEILEKNELLLSWYGNLCSIYNIDIKNYLNKFNYLADDIKIFISKNLSNAFCVMVFVFKNKRIIGSGLSLDLDYEVALNSAINEAKLLTIIYNNRSYSFYKNLSDLEHNKLYNHIVNLQNSNYDINYDKGETLSLNFKNDFRIAYINFFNNYGSKTIKIYSEYLYNCLPSIKNIKSKKKQILIDFNLNLNFDLMPDCLII